MPNLRRLLERYTRSYSARVESAHCCRTIVVRNLEDGGLMVYIPRRAALDVKLEPGTAIKISEMEITERDVVTYGIFIEEDL